MPGFRRSTWFALGLIMGSLIGSALALLVGPAPADMVRHSFRASVAPGVQRVRGVSSRLARRDDPRAEPSEAGFDTERVPQEATDAT